MKKDYQKPPNWALYFFRWFCHPDYAEDIEGDLYEKFDRNCQAYGQKAARRKFIWAVLTLFKPSLIRTFEITFLQNTTIMFRHNLKLSWRLLFKNKGFSLINIGGLAMGMAMAMFIVLWIKDELSFDQFHTNGNRIYKVMRHVYSGDEIETNKIVTWNISETLRTEYPEVEKVAVVSRPTEVVLNKAAQSFRETGFYAQPAFFDILSWNLVAGNVSTLLTEPNAIVISSTLAERYFDVSSDNYAAVIGQTVKHNEEGLGDFKVTGVFAEVPKQSSLQFDFVLPMDIFFNQNEWLTDWNNSGVYIFLEMKAGQDAMSLSTKIKDIQNEHIESFRSDLFLHPYVDQHLYSNFKDGMLSGGRIEYVRVFALIALMIMLIACINFMNLSTAHSVQRVKEIGVRKAIGAEKRGLIGQFMGESFLLISLAFGIALTFIVLLLPYFNLLTEKTLTLSNLDAGTWAIFGGIGLLTTLIAGIYPAFYLSSFNPVKILKGTFQQSTNSAYFRKGLVVFQFTMSILLMVGTITVYQQMQYIQHKNLGFDRTNVISVPLEAAMREQYNVVREELLQLPTIEGVTSCNANPLNIRSNTHSVNWRGKKPDSQQSMNILATNFDYAEVMKLEIVEGRDFDLSYSRDSFNYLINEKALAVMGFDNPIGEALDFWGSSGEIVGVVKDFHLSSLYSDINPMVIMLRPNWSGNLLVRTKSGKSEEALASIAKIHARFNPDYPFEFSFLDSDYDEMYKSEKTIGRLSLLFTFFALFIAGIGLLGLSIFAIQRRLKEISVRKVLGANMGNLVLLLSKDFVLLILIAFILATPVAFWAMQDWLDNFSYSTNLGVGVFLFAAAITLFITLLTVGFYALKVAVINPIQSLQE